MPLSSDKDIDSKRKTLDYELSRLNSRSFEQLVQALAAGVIAKGILIFGDGPDGGREASYSGQVPYPSSAEKWDGNIVLQAKFRQHPVSSRSDTAWALKNLREELEDTFEESTRRVHPTHYIFATNVSLSAVPEKGGRARLEAVAKEFPLEDFHIWDYTQLCAYIDGNKDVRNAFLGYICPGDVLAEISEHLKAQTPNFDKIIANYLEKELVADQYVNLEQAGQVSDEKKIPISQVFIDLPMQSEKTSVEQAGFTDEILSISREHLSPEFLYGEGASHKTTAAASPERGRLVLVGGPGQGKTTIGQFICQLFRTSLLVSRPPHSISAEARPAVELLTAHCEKDGIELPTVRRFPIRIPLMELSDSLASEDPPNSLLEFMARRISRRVSRELPNETFRTWLGEYPWLLVLDGLDEVPASSNRGEILKLISDFWIDASHENSDVLVLATTRPQGYNDDFSPTYYRHISLAPLSSEDALRYGCRLAEARHEADEAKRDKLIERLTEAAQNPATAKLMTSPLQVTIMATLVDRGGRPPEERWKLFSEYYNVIYMREVEREIPAADVLRHHKPDIDEIHRRVAMVLQVGEERASQGEARMPHDRFAAIVRQRLREEGHEGDSLAELEQQIITAAGDRLVFLVGLREDEVGFEIRSLQEFMAGEALMTGGDERITARLRAIAGITSWRNVFLFAAGQCFALAEKQHLRDTIYTICGELNDPVHDPLASITLPGSVLAADLLAEKLPRRQPAHSSLFAKEALKLLGSGEGEIEDLLLQAYKPSLEQCYREALEGVLQQDSQHRESGLSMLMALDENGVNWARDVIDANVPHDGAGLLELLDVVDDSIPEWAAERAAASAGELSFFGAIRHSSALQEMGYAALSDVQYVEKGWERDSIPLQGPLGHRFELSIQPVQGSEAAGVFEGSDRGLSIDRWPGLAAMASFMKKPTHRELGQQLHRIADDVPLEQWQTLEGLCPWPMSAVLIDADGDPEYLHELADLAESGAFGDFDAWSKAEMRWQEHGISREDLDYVASGDGSMDRSIAVQGFPVNVAGWTVNGSAVAETVNTLLDLLENLTNPKSREVLVEWVIDLARTPIFQREVRLEAGRFAKAVIETNPSLIARTRDRLPIDRLSWAKSLSGAELELLELIGLSLGPSSEAVTAGGKPPLAKLPPGLVKLWNDGKMNAGLYRLLALGLPVAHTRAIKVSAPPEKIATAEPGAAAVLLLKRKDWPTFLDQAILLLSEAGGGEPIWLQCAVSVLQERTAEPESGKALKKVWDIVQSGSLDPDDAESIAQQIRHLAQSTLDQRATSLKEPRAWRELGLFEPPPLDQDERVSG